MLTLGTSISSETVPPTYLSHLLQRSRARQPLASLDCSPSSANKPLGVVDELGFFRSAVCVGCEVSKQASRRKGRGTSGTRLTVGPEDDVSELALVVRCFRSSLPRVGRDGDGLSRVDVGRDERARRVEPDSLDERRVNLGFAEDVLASRRDAGPD